jgi:DNA-binding MarR family transcriptional regulator
MNRKTESDSKKSAQHKLLKKKSKKTKKFSHDEIVKKLNGRTLMIYFVLLNKGSTGVRELQRHLELSSPSVALYHLDKLVDLDLVEKRSGKYELLRKADIPVLTSWVLIGRRLLPRVLFMAVFFSIFFLGYLIFVFRFWNRDSSFAILFGILIMSYLWMDVILQLKNKPI